MQDISENIKEYNTSGEKFHAQSVLNQILANAKTRQSSEHP